MEKEVPHIHLTHADLERLREALGGITSYRIAKLLDVTPTAAWRWYTKKTRCTGRHAYNLLWYVERTQGKSALQKAVPDLFPMLQRLNLKDIVKNNRAQVK